MTNRSLLPRRGNGILLRTLEGADLLAFQAYRCDPALAAYQGWSAQSDEDAQAFLEEMHLAAPFEPGRWYQIGVCSEESQELIGDLGVRVSTAGSEAEFGVSLNRNYHGRGFATNAVRTLFDLLFSELLLKRIFAVTDARNLASIQLLERLGMTRVRTDEAIFRGAPCLEHLYQLDPAVWNHGRASSRFSAP